MLELDGELSVGLEVREEGGSGGRQLVDGLARERARRCCVEVGEVVLELSEGGNQPAEQQRVTGQGEG